MEKIKNKKILWEKPVGDDKRYAVRLFLYAFERGGKDLLLRLKLYYFRPHKKPRYTPCLTIDNIVENTDYVIYTAYHNYTTLFRRCIKEGQYSPFIKYISRIEGGVLSIETPSGKKDNPCYIISIEKAR